MTRPAIAGLILSGGASRRMGFPKALLTFQGETFLDRLARVLGTVCRPLAAVLGHDCDRIRRQAACCHTSMLVVNPDPERGMLSSLQCGLAALGDSAAVMFTPVDYPAIREATVWRVAQAYAESGAPVAIPTYGGQRGHPVCVSRKVIAELLALPAEAQARDVIRGYYDKACFVEVNDAGIVCDIDSPEDYRVLDAMAEARR